MVLIYRTREPYDDLARAICFCMIMRQNFKWIRTIVPYGADQQAQNAAVLGNRVSRQLTIDRYSAGLR